MANKPKWGEETFRRVYEMDKAIALPSNPQKYRDIYDGLTYEQMWEYSPAAGLDERFPFPLQIAGSEFEIRLQASFGKWLHDVLGRRLGYLVKFEDFWEQWSEKGFTWAINRTGTPGLSTNYPFQDTTKPDGTKVSGWRTDRDTRPGFIEWKNPNKKAMPYYRVIEYWPDKSDVNTSYVLVGSDSQIIQHIIQIEYSGGSATAEDDYFGGGFPKRMGQPQVTLYFREDKEDVEPGWHPVKGNIAFRLMDVTEDPSSQKTKITWNFIKNLANKIYEEFQAPNNKKGFIWKKGREYFNYNDWNLGYGFKVLCREPTHGEEIVKKILKIREHSYDSKKASRSEPMDVNAYPIVPGEETILGVKVRQKRRRPIASVRFYAARLTLAKYGQIPLVLNGTVQSFHEDGREGELA